MTDMAECLSDTDIVLLAVLCDKRSVVDDAASRSDDQPSSGGLCARDIVVSR